MRRRPPDADEEPVRLHAAGTPPRRPPPAAWPLPLAIGLVLGVGLAFVYGGMNSAPMPTPPSTPVLAMASTLTAEEVRRIAAEEATKATDARRIPCEGLSPRARKAAGCEDTQIKREDIPCYLSDDGCRIDCTKLSYDQRKKRGCLEEP